MFFHLCAFSLLVNKSLVPINVHARLLQRKKKSTKAFIRKKNPIRLLLGKRMLLQIFLKIRKVHTYLHTYLIFWHSVGKRIVMMKIGCLPTQWKSLVLKRAKKIFIPGPVYSDWGNMVFLYLTLLGLGLIKIINNVSANFNNPRPSLILNK